MRVKVTLIIITIFLAGCTSGELNPQQTNNENQSNFLTSCQGYNNHTILMNIFQGLSLENSTSKYSICVQLNFNSSPIHSENFKTHVIEGNYNSTNFHRIMDDFMIQGGDFQNKDGTGGYASNWYGYCDGQSSTDSNCSGNGQNSWTVPDEADNGLNHLPCTISMAKRSAPNTGSSQFFIIPEDSTPSHLDGVHTVFGEIIEGCENVTKISEVSTTSYNRPIVPISIYSAVAFD